MKSIIKFALLILVLLSDVANAASEEQSAQLFSKMKSLVGVWGEQGAENDKFSISFELTANDTTLIKTWLYNGRKHSLTLYHLDGEHLLATHYCPQGNQPRLQLSDDATVNNPSFTYRDATNLKSLDDSHQHVLRFDLSDIANKVVRGESYLSAIGESRSKLVLVRK